MKRSTLAAALRTEVRRLSRQQVGAALRPLLKVQRQVSTLRRETHEQRLLLSVSSAGYRGCARSGERAFPSFPAAAGVPSPANPSAGFATSCA